MRRLCGTVLAMEAVIALLAIVPAKVLGHTSAGTAAAVCGAVALIAIVLSGLANWLLTKYSTPPFWRKYEAPGGVVAG